MLAPKLGECMCSRAVLRTTLRVLWIQPRPPSNHVWAQRVCENSPVGLGYSSVHMDTDPIAFRVVSEQEGRK